MYKGKLRALGTVEELKDLVPGGDVVEVYVEDAKIPGNVLEELGNYGKVRFENGLLRLYLEKGEEKAIQIIDVLRHYNIPVSKLMIKEPSLDDVFTYLTGARLREE